MKHPVIAIGLDSADPLLLEKWMSQGYLKNLSNLRQQGAYGRLISMEYYKGESAWTSFLTGCLPHTTGYWSKTRFNKQTYEVKKVGTHGGYDFAEYPPFYDVGDDYRVAVFDLPQATLAKQVNGIQALAWGAHAPMGPRVSQPKELLSDLINQYGDHPADAASHNDRSDWYNSESVAKLQRELSLGLSLRTAITRDLAAREPWDLFLTVIGETHTAQHYLWHLSQSEHPLYNPQTAATADPMLEFFEAVDQSLGELLAEAPEDAHVVVFSAHGQGSNSADLLSMIMLPEFLYRFSFPDKSLLNSQPIGTPLTKPLVPKNKKQGWYRQLDNLKNEPDVAAKVLRFVAQALPGRFHKHLAKLYKQLGKLRGSAQSPLFSWHPSEWYQPFWSQMKAFYLPGFSDGYIRINLKGRESQGIVSLAEYDALCEELIKELHLLTDPRSGKPVVKKVVRTRQNPMDSNSKLPDADLVVVWEDWAVDVIDSPTYGRIGPVYFNRTGAHRARGFVVAKGPGIAAGSNLAEGHAVDLAPTILEMMGAPIPQRLDGKPLAYSDGKPLVSKEALV
ncbi:alkaline phosphatase family protein [Lyngbya aestuarii]|uniref:alkaline phosphatase family protein n=1 Tax=Lyngbya aestuarii TaxID=118322 RepID=UPI00403DDE63